MTLQNQRTRTVLVTLTSLLLLTFVSPRAAAQQPSQAGVVIDFGNGVTTTRCIEFTEAEISGYDLLRRSGLAIVADESSALGVIICDIGNTSGCNPSRCFCRCQGTACSYWMYFQLEGGAWRYSPTGCSATVVQHGDVEGWAWGEGTPSQAAAPPVIGFEEICGSMEQAPAPTETVPIAAQPTAAPTSPPPTPTPSAAPATAVPATATPSPAPIERPPLSPSPSPSSTTPAATARPEAPTPSPALSTARPAARPTVSDSPPAAGTREHPLAASPAGTVPTSPTTREALAGDEPESPVSPWSSYAVFGAIGALLLGLLIYLLRSRGHRA